MTQSDVISMAHAETTEDVFLGDRLRVHQPSKGYRAGIDAVLLAACVEAGATGTVLDIGAGAGTVGLCVAVRCTGIRAVLVERAPEFAALGRANSQANGLSDRVEVVEADVTAPLSDTALCTVQPDTFAHVLANPPFHDDGTGTAADHPLKAASHAMPAGALEMWVRFMARMTKPGGRATMIHKADALSRILSAYENRFGGIIILPIHPRDGAPAIRVLVQGIKGSRAPLVIKAGLILHGEGNAFRPDVDAVLRRGSSLDL